MHYRKTWLAVAVCGSLAACGETVTEQALIGGGAGALAAVAIQGNPVLGSVAGVAGNVAYCELGPGNC